MSQICPGLAVRDCGRKVQATKSHSEIQIDVDVDVKKCTETTLQVFGEKRYQHLGIRLG